MKYKLHPFCELFPKMTEEEFADHCESLRKNGLREKIIIFKDMVLDGRHRQEGCEITGTKPIFEKFKGTEDEAFEFVMDKNFRRRQLTTSQRAAVAAAYADRKKSGVSIVKASTALNVSRQSVQTAKRIKKKSPKLFKQVRDGKISLNAAETKIKKAEPAYTKPARDYTDVYTSGKTIKETRSLGQICFDAYMKELGDEAHPVSGDWDKMQDKEKAAWQAGAESVKGKI